MRGRIDITQLKNPPQKHELETAGYFAERGYDIEFIPPSNIPEVHRPDIIMNGLEWELKSPTGKGRRTILRNMKYAAKQSHNIIIDLRRTSISEKKCVLEIEKRFDERPNIKRVLVIKKNGDLLTFSEKGEQY